MSRDPSRAKSGTRPGQDLVAMLFVLSAVLTFFTLGKGSAPYFATVFIGAGIGLMYLRRDGASRTASPPSISAKASELSAPTLASPMPHVAMSTRNAPAAPRETPVRAWDAVMPLYSLQTKFFSRTELAFYRALTRAVGTRYSVFAKVRLLDLCAIAPTGDYNAMNRVSAKHVDFLLCESSTFAPVAAIEVDGASHQRPDRIERDAFVDDLFDQIGLPLIRVAAAYWFEPADLARRIDSAVQAALLEPTRRGVRAVSN